DEDLPGQLLGEGNIHDPFRIQSEADKFQVMIQPLVEVKDPYDEQRGDHGVIRFLLRFIVKQENLFRVFGHMLEQVLSPQQIVNAENRAVMENGCVVRVKDGFANLRVGSAVDKDIIQKIVVIGLHILNLRLELPVQHLVEGPVQGDPVA